MGGEREGKRGGEGEREGEREGWGEREGEREGERGLSRCNVDVHFCYSSCMAKTK